MLCNGSTPALHYEVYLKKTNWKLINKNFEGATFILNGISLSVNIDLSFIIVLCPKSSSASSPFSLSIPTTPYPPWLPLLFAPCACGCQGNSSNLPTHVPVGQGAIRGLSTSLSSCYKWCWQDGEGPRLCFEGQQGRSPALCQWLLGPAQTSFAKYRHWSKGPIQPHTHITTVTSPGFECISRL